MTQKTLFNRKHGQSPGETNSKEDISKMTGITVRKLNEVWDKGFKDYKYADIPNKKKIPAGAFAMGAVYIYALSNNTQKRKKK